MHESGSIVEHAQQAASVGAAAARVEVRELEEWRDIATAREFLMRVSSQGTRVPSVRTLQELKQAGNYVAAALADGLMQAVRVSFFGLDAEGLYVHPYLQAILTDEQHLGMALAVHQRAWALRRGIARIR